MTLSVLLIDDHPTFRAGLALAVRELAGDVVVLEAACVDRALDLLGGALRHDLIVYDWYLPGGGGLAGLAALLQLAPTTPLVVMSGTLEAAVREIAVQMGAAYISKSADTCEIRQTLGSLLNGGACTAVPAPVCVADAAAPNSRHGATNGTLTGRQREIVPLLFEGRSNKDIAKQLGISEATARDHVSDVLRALSAKNRTEAVSNALKLGLIRLPPRAN